MASDASAQGQTHTLTASGVNGGWNWCMDPRTFYDNGKVHTGWITTTGSVEVNSFDLATSTKTTTNLVTGFERDDHDNPSFFKTSDGRYTSFWSTHTVNNNLIQTRTTINPGDTTSWKPTTTVPTNVAGSWGVTYPTPMAVPGQPDKAYLVWRGGNWKPTYSVGTYSTSTQSWSWSAAQNYYNDNTNNSFIRPYVIGGSDASHAGFIFTDAHPHDGLNHLYYASFGVGPNGNPAYLRADGSLIKYTSAGPVAPGEAEKVFDRTASPAVNGNSSWGWDLAYDNGKPVVAYATFLPTNPAATTPTNNSSTVHQYHYARFDGTQWVDYTLVPDAGGSIANTSLGNQEFYYSGGLCIDPVDPSIVYLCRKVNGQFELEQWKTADGGATWTTKTITSSPNLEDVRPVVPVNRPKNVEMVVWMSGQYTYWTPNVNGSNGLSYDTAINLWTNPVPEPASLLLAALPLWAVRSRGKRRGARGVRPGRPRSAMPAAVSANGDRRAR